MNLGELSLPLTSYSNQEIRTSTLPGMPSCAGPVQYGGWGKVSQILRTEQEVALPLLWVGVGRYYPLSPCPSLLDVRVSDLALFLTGCSTQENKANISPG